MSSKDQLKINQVAHSHNTNYQTYMQNMVRYILNVQFAGGGFTTIPIRLFAKGAIYYL